MVTRWWGVLALVAGGYGATAEAKVAPRKSGPVLAVSAEHVGYTRGIGSKSIVGSSAQVSLGGSTKLGFGVATGAFRSAKVRHRGTGLSATLNHELGAGLSSRTTIARGRAGPLFSGLTVGEELGWRSGGTELRAGGRLSRFSGGGDVRSLHAGAGRKLGPVTLDFSLAYYAKARSIPRGLVQRLEGEVGDRLGNTVAQLARGSSLHEHDWRASKVAGSFTSVGLKRKQDLGSALSVELGGSWTAFKRPGSRYGAAKLSAGLSLKR